MSARLEQLIDLIERNYHGRAWQGSTLKGVLRRVRVQEALRSPGRGRKSIWEQALHAAYWKYVVRRRIEGTGGPKFPRSPANWPNPSGRAEAAWAKDLAVLDEEHRRLIAAARRVDPKALDRVPPKGRSATTAMLLMGVASHDVYHTGQIQLIRALGR